MNLNENENNLKKILKNYLQVEKHPIPLFSKKIKDFLLLFFCMKSRESDFNQLSKIDKIFFLIILIKKQYKEIPQNCLCFKKIKRME